MSKVVIINNTGVYPEFERIYSLKEHDLLEVVMTEKGIAVKHMEQDDKMVKLLKELEEAQKIKDFIDAVQEAIDNSTETEEPEDG